MSPVQLSLYRSPACVAWHVGDVLSFVMGHDVSLRGPAAVNAFRTHLVGEPPDDDASTTAIATLIRIWLVAHFPSMGSFTEADRPCRELLSVWLTRRAAQYSEYLVVPPIPANVIASHLEEAEEAKEDSATQTVDA